MGRHRKTLEQHAKDGTINTTKHAGRMREPKFDGSPEMPSGMLKAARELWQLLVPQLVAKGVAKSADGPALQAMCEAWAEYRKALRLPMGPTTKEARERQACIKGYLQMWRDLASRFGLTPSDRARLEVSVGEDASNPFEAFLKQRMGNG